MYPLMGMSGALGATAHQVGQGSTGEVAKISEELAAAKATIEALGQELAAKDATFAQMSREKAKTCEEARQVVADMKTMREDLRAATQELFRTKQQHLVLKKECIAFWKQIHSVQLPNQCLGMGEEVAHKQPALQEATAAEAGKDKDTDKDSKTAKPPKEPAAGEAVEEPAGSAAAKEEQAPPAAAVHLVTKVLPSFHEFPVEGADAEDLKEWIRDVGMNSIMGLVSEENFQPSFSTTDDQKSFDTLVYKAIGVLTLARPHSAGRMWKHWAPLVTVLNLVRRYPGTASIGYSLNVYDMLNLSYDFKGEKTAISYGRIPVAGVELDGLTPGTGMYMYVIKASHGHKIAEDGGAAQMGGGGGGKSSGAKGRGKYTGP